MASFVSWIYFLPNTGVMPEDIWFDHPHTEPLRVGAVDRGSDYRDCRTEATDGVPISAS